MKNSRVDALIAPWVQSLKPYAVEDAAGLIKLDAMENPYPFPQELVPDWLDKVRNAEINRYPDPAASALKRAIRQHLNLPQELSISLGNGSDEIIHMLCLAFNRPGAKMLSPAPSFAVYPLAAAALGMEFVGVPLNRSDFSLDLPAIKRAIDEHDPALIFLASPNNPTGNRFSKSAVADICRWTNGLVVLDEAYWRFAGDNAISDLATTDNLVFMHTLSKIGLAGIRVGALLGRGDWLEPVEKVRMPYNLSSLTQVTGCFALAHDTVFAKQVELICDSRRQLCEHLGALSGLSFWPSETNFILLKVDGDANIVHRSLRDNGVLIKNLNGVHPFLENCLRVSVGTDEENEIFIKELKRAL